MKITKRLAAKEQQQRRRNLTKYIPNAAAAIFPVLESMAENDAVGTKRQLLQAGCSTRKLRILAGGNILELMIGFH